MKCYIVDSFIGFFAYDEDLKLISAKTFDDAEEGVAQLYELEKSGSCSRLEGFVDDLTKMGFDSFMLEDELEAKFIKSRFSVESQFMLPSEGGKVFRSSVAGAAASIGMKESAVNKMLKAVSEDLVRLKVRLASEKRDRLVAEAVAALDEVDKNVNIGVSRVREWYGLHFPELDGLVPDHRQYLDLISKFGTRSRFEEATVDKIIQNENKAKVIVETAGKSMGATIGDVDLKQIRALVDVSLRMYSARDELERYIDETMKEVAPNLRELVGAGLGGRLIAAAGSLEGLAKKPASTVQVIGAEKALFRSLKTGARPPKHGIIFQHQYIHNAPRWQRGKIARALAGKLSIAARVDCFGGEFVADSLKAALDKRLADIQKKYSKPPVREKSEFRSFGGGRDRFGGGGGGGGGGRDRWGGRDRRGDKKFGRDRRWRR